ncbi:MAG TPA: hypothetical protein VFO79_06440, partial [Xanthomonadales bacterium]|nr:hypothetical protein [Xanthomonadales bacterium]
SVRADAAAPAPAPVGDAIAAHDLVPAVGDVLVDVSPEHASPATGRLRAGTILGLVVVVVVAATWLFAHYIRPGSDTVMAPGAATTAPAPAGASPTATPAAVHSLALLPPRIDASDAAMRALAFAYIDGLHDALARFPGLQVAGRDSARVAVLREQRPAKAGELLGVDHVMQVAMAHEDGRIALELELLRVADHRRVWQQRFVEPREQLFRSFGPVLDAVQRVVAIEPGADPLRAAPATAQDLYWRGMIELQIYEPGSPQRAIALFEQAIAIEPRFALAHVGIAQAWRTAVGTRDASIDEAATKGRVAVARALELDPQLVSAYIAEALLLTMQWRTVDAAVPVRRARSIAPQNPGVLALTANLATYDGRPLDALPTRERLIEVDPLSPIAHGLMARDYAAAGRLDDALAKTNEALAITPSSEFAHDGAARILAAYGRFADAARHFDSARAGYRDLYARLAMASVATALGDYEAAERELAAFTPKTPEPPGYAQTIMALHWARDEYDEALRWIEGPGRGAVQEPWGGVLRAHALALAGRRDDALALYREIFSDVGNRDLLATSAYALHLGLGEIANWAVLERESGGDASDAVAYLQRRLEVMDKGGYRMPVYEYYRAIAALMRDDTAAADAALGAALERGWRDRPALDADLAWRSHDGAAWLAARRAQLAAVLDAERVRMPERAPAGGTVPAG